MDWPGTTRLVVAAVLRALSSTVPGVELLAPLLERSSPPGAPPAPPSPSTAASTSRCPQSVTSSAPGATATGGAAAGAREEAVAGHQSAAADDETAKQRLELQILEVKAKRVRAHAAPSPLGEQLCYAATCGKLEAVRRLLDSGADVNYTNRGGRTALIDAIFRFEAQAGVASLLLERGADVNAVDLYGTSALHFAVDYGASAEIVTLLIGAGADVDARDEDGATPLHFAARHANEAAARALLAAGARTSLRGWGADFTHQTPYDIAASSATRHLLRLGRPP